MPNEEEIIKDVGVGEEEDTGAENQEDLEDVQQADDVDVDDEEDAVEDNDDVDGEDDDDSDDDDSDDDDSEEVAGDGEEQPSDTAAAEESRTKFIDQAKKLLPELPLANEADVYDAVIQRVVELETYRTENEDAIQKIASILDENPELGQIIRDVSMGASTEEAIARNLDVDALRPAEGDPDYPAWAAAKQERQKRNNAAKAFQLTLQKNRQASIQNISAFQAEKKLTQEDTDKFLTAVNTALTSVMDGLVTKEFMDLMWKSLNFDKAVKESETKGVIQGANKRIDELKGKKKKVVVPNIRSQGGQEDKAPNRVASEISRYVKKRQIF